MKPSNSRSDFQKKTSSSSGSINNTLSSSNVASSSSSSSSGGGATNKSVSASNISSKSSSVTNSPALLPKASSSTETKDNYARSHSGESSKTTILPPPNTEKCLPFFPVTLFSEKNFSEGYNEVEFIENLTYKLLNEVNKLNPSNSGGSSTAQELLEDKQAEYLEVFQQLFQRSIFEMEKLMKDVNVTVERLMKDTEIASQKHQSKLQSFHEELETISEKFKNIEDVINQVGNTTVQVGNTLDTVDKQKSRAIEAKQLMRFFNEFNSYDPETFKREILPEKKFKNALFKKKGSRHRAAKIMQDLKLIADDLIKVESCKNAVVNIKLYNDDLIRTLLEDFSYSIRLLEDNRKQAISDMKKKAKILFDIKCEEKCIELYVKMRFERFINVAAEHDNIDKEFSKKLLEETQDKVKRLEALRQSLNPEKKESDDDEEGDYDERGTSSEKNTNSEKGTSTDTSQNKQQNEQEIKEEIANLEKEIQERTKAIEEQKAVKKELAFQECREKAIEFVENVSLYPVFLSKVEKATTAEHSIISEVFPNSTRDVILMYLLKIVDLIVEEIVNRLLKEPKNESSDFKDLEAYLFDFETIYNSTMDFVERVSNELSEISTLKSTLSRSIENIFFNKKKSYGDIEKDYVVGYYESITEDIDREEKVIMSQLIDIQVKKGVYSGVFSSSVIPNLSQVVMNALQDPDQSRLIQAYPRLQLDIVVSFIHTNTEALTRCKKLSSKNDIPKNMLAIFELLKNSVYDYVKRCLEFSVATLEGTSSKKEPPMELYQTIQLTNSVLQKIQRHLEQNVLPSIVSVSLPIQLQCIKLKDDLFSSLESYVVRGLELMLKAIVKYCDYIFEKEQKSTAADYKPKENDQRFVFVEHQPTLACSKCCAFLSAHADQIQTCLFGKNREYFLTKLGVHIFQLLSNELRKYSVSDIGAIKLMRDLSEYQKTIRQFQVSAVEDQFDTLREIANVLLVLPQNLVDVVQQLEKNPSVKHEDVVAFIRMRSDYKTAKPIFKDKIAGFH